MHDLDRTLRSQEWETDGELEFSDQEYADHESSISEEQELEYAAELLSISEEAELDHFLGKLLKKAGRFVKPLAKTLLPIAGKVAGGFFGGPAGAAIGGQLGSFATRLFEVDMESIAPEEREMEVAKNFVRLATAAADQAAKAPSGADPLKVARVAVIKAAQTHAPGLVRPKRCGAKTGRWIRRGNRIMVLGA